jgi:hypothetical protein
MPDKPKSDIILYHKGKLDYDVIGELIHELKHNMKVRNVRFGLYKKLLTLMIEMLENVIRYRENFIGNLDVINEYPPEFQIVYKAHHYIIEASNAIRKEDVIRLENKIVELNNMDKKEIKDLYKSTITNGQFSEKGGAGLGMIEMAKLVDRKIEFEFKEIDNTFSFFLLRLSIKGSMAEN